MYYPKSKISDPKRTAGTDFVIKSTNKPYAGMYFETSGGKIFTGKSPSSGDNQELIKSNSVVSETTKNIPVYFYPVPTEDDYKRGYMFRYFMKKRNASYITIIEISLDDYNRLNVKDPQLGIDTELYAVINLRWKITGPLYNDFRDKNHPKAGIVDTNKNLVKSKDKVFPGFSLFITDYSQFSRPS